MSYIPLIIILCLILAIIIAIFCGLYYVRNKTREFSQMAFGTSDIAEGIKNLKVAEATTPKSVSAMTSLLLPKITADFPDFEFNEMKERADNVLIGYLRGITERNAALCTEANTELREQLNQHIQMLSAKNLHEHFDMIKIHRTEINQYRKTPGRCIITFQSALECYHYVTDSSGNVTAGQKEYKYQTKYNVDIIYIQNRDLVENELENALGVNCPNCGAPLSSLGAKTCEYCGSPIIEINIHAWSFSNVKEIT